MNIRRNNILRLFIFGFALLAIPFLALKANATAEKNILVPKEGVLYTLSWAESEKRIFSLEFPLYHAINTDTLACGPLVTSLYNKDFPYSKPDVTNLTCAFSFKEVQNGYYIIIPATAPDVCLQVSLGSTYKTLYGRKFDNQPEQLWTITPCEGGIQISNAAVPDLVLGLRDGVGSMDVCMTTGEWVFSLEESQIVFLEHRIHVKAPDFWAPCIGYGSGNVFMPKGEDGWYSYYYSGNGVAIANQGISSPMAQVLPPDFSIGVQTENPDKDYWVVISDDPNVDGDLAYKVYDYNPDEEPPKTADPVILAVPALGLLASAIALSYLLRRRKPA